MKYSANGSPSVTLTKDRPGFYSAAGHTQVTDQTLTSTRVGVTSPDGSMNVTILANETVRTGLYAANGSINVVDGAGNGIYSPCGAYNVTFV